MWLKKSWTGVWMGKSIALNFWRTSSQHHGNVGEGLNVRMKKRENIMTTGVQRILNGLTIL